jgi:hypothetical protein
MIVEYFAKQKTRKHVQISIFFFFIFNNMNEIERN